MRPVQSNAHLIRSENSPVCGRGRRLLDSPHLIRSENSPVCGRGRRLLDSPQPCGGLCRARDASCLSVTALEDYAELEMHLVCL
ncbi:hypothetical protein RRG08_017475 [Elysia crispata]|uniref:Uncharacterized protein n=1 Tax=Elysia crispata TaxID=231223 RepID=A0AAE0YI60_9GAST|nr:hypothetical protein RRG08_017475 [Elysia crispata]